jgi:hypothetical protein
MKRIGPSRDCANAPKNHSVLPEASNEQTFTFVYRIRSVMVRDRRHIWSPVDPDLRRSVWSRPSRHVICLTAQLQATYFSVHVYVLMLWNYVGCIITHVKITCKLHLQYSRVVWRSEFHTTLPNSCQFLLLV